MLTLGLGLGLGLGFVGRDGSLADLIPSTVFHLDATAVRSWPGSGQLWKNLVRHPADGEAQSAYDFYFGADGNASTDDPSPIGATGARGTHMLFDGSDRFKLAGAMTDTLKNIHKTSNTQPFWFALDFKFVQNDAQQQLFSTGNSTSSTHGIWITVASNERAGLAQGNGAGTVTHLAPDTLVNGTDYILIASHDPVTATSRIWIDDATKYEATHTFGATTTAPSGYASIGRNNAGTGAVPNGTKVRQFAFGYGPGAFIDNAEAQVIINRFERRRTQAALPSLMGAILDGDSLSSSQIWSTTDPNSLLRRSVGYFIHTAAQTYQLFDTRIAQGFGTGGHRIEDMLADQAAPLAYAAANRTDAVFVMLGANDVENTGRSVAQLTTDYTTFIEAYADLAHEPYVFVGLPTPRGDWEADTEEVRAVFVQRLHDIRSAITTICDNYGERVRLFDAWNSLVDTDVTNTTTSLNYFPKAGHMNADGIHLSMIGAHYVGKACSAAVNATPLWSKPVALPATSGAINTNPGLTGTGGSASTGASGQVADNCRVQRASGSNLTLTCSKETTTIFGISQVTQKIVLANATAAEEGYFYLEYPAPTVEFDGTEGLEAIVPIKVAASPVGLTGLYLYARTDIGGTVYTTRDMTWVSSNFVVSNDGGFEWLLRTEPFQVPAGTTTQFQILIRMPVDGTVVGSGATINIGQCIVRKAAS